MHSTNYARRPPVIDWRHSTNRTRFLALQPCTGSVRAVALLQALFFSLSERGNPDERGEDSDAVDHLFTAHIALLKVLISYFGIHSQVG